MAEEAGRRGTPEQDKPTDEHYDLPSEPAPLPAEPSAESLSLRGTDEPPLPAPLYRKRVAERRTVVKSVRFTPTAHRVIEHAAAARGSTFAGFIGDAALALALGKHELNGSPEDDPIRPLTETIERHRTELRRIGINLNQITRALNTGAIPDHAEAVLTLIEQAVERDYLLLDHFLADDTETGD
ncbi:plasmid mobilization relaxosome protein MobC [Streptomyces boncukensis]|uniref:Plasmid mobilization relaxosome protein MobC n=1 Tax=Streptomyces boncukensis TaxID=2711219 RepID=A0A6G4WVZ1_9ACTN|nr:plasmid mobilization relaxosome protein MobC [Streptomyces boncukensis]